MQYAVQKQTYQQLHIVCKQHPYPKTMHVYRKRYNSTNHMLVSFIWLRQGTSVNYEMGPHIF